MNSVQDAFKHNRARKNVILGGAAIMVCITVLSCVSSFVIYRGGFTDVPHPFDKLLALFAVIVVEGAFVWLVYGFTRAFSSALERFIAVCGITFLCAVMLMNLITHFMMVKGISLDDFQQSWSQWAAVSVFIGVLLIVLFITLADPVIRLIRLELRSIGQQEELILRAKSEALEDSVIREAMTERASIEALAMADKILKSLPPKPTTRSQPDQFESFRWPDEEDGISHEELHAGYWGQPDRDGKKRWVWTHPQHPSFKGSGNSGPKGQA